MRETPSTAGSMIGFVGLAVSLLPAVHAYNLAEPVSGLSYVLPALAGSLVGYPLLLLGLKVLKNRGGELWAQHSWATSSLFLLPPAWGIGILMTLNVVLATSPEEHHESVFLRVERCGKGGMCPYVRSWQAEQDELRLRPGAVPTWSGEFVPGTPIDVITRQGRLGIEYIVAVRKR